jgi:regulatory protein
MRKIQNPQQYAVYLLSRREYSPKDFTRKLIRKFPEQQSEIEALVQKLQSEDYLSEERFALSYTRYLVLTTTKGPQAIKQSLFQKGVSAEVAQNAIDTEVKQEIIDENLIRLIEKKQKEVDRKNPEKSDFEKKQKVVQYLMRKGYSTDNIFKHLNQ